MRTVGDLAARAIRRHRRLARWLAAALGAMALMLGVFVALPAAAAASQWIAVSAGATHTCAIKADTTLWCWGSNYAGQLGTGDNTDRSTPAAVQAGAGWSAISAGNGFTCGIRIGYRYCWGLNDNGQLGVGFKDSDGDGVNDSYNVPKHRGGEADNWATVSTGQSHACGVRNSGTGQCWGQNLYGALGLGDTVDRNTPRTVSGEYVWTSISAGAYHSCGLDSSRHRFCWGVNDSGELGLPGDATFHSVPADGGVGWLAVDAGDFTNCGYSTGRRLYCWGKNTFGQAGVGDTVPHDEDMLVSTGTWSAVSSGGGHTCAIRTNGNLYCWGHNESGQLGLGDTTDRWDETALPSQSPQWTAVSAGLSHTCGIRTDATLWCWGYNFTGQLGNGATTSSATPVLVL